MSQTGPQYILDCYRRGVFPMAESRNESTVFLVDPETRGIIPLDGLHIPRSLAKFMRKMPFSVTFNKAFERVISLCAEPADDREDTWINPEIEYLYTILHEKGHVHSVEVWHGEKLVGGLYGVAIGGAFFGESMFSRETNASKVALVKLVEHLNERGFVLLDAQFMTKHLASLGALEITRAEYHDRLDQALKLTAQF